MRLRHSRRITPLTIADCQSLIASAWPAGSSRPGKRPEGKKIPTNQAGMSNGITRIPGNVFRGGPVRICRLPWPSVEGQPPTVAVPDRAEAWGVRKNSGHKNIPANQAGMSFRISEMIGKLPRSVPGPITGRRRAEVRQRPKGETSVQTKLECPLPSARCRETFRPLAKRLPAKFRSDHEPSLKA